MIDHFIQAVESSVMHIRQCQRGIAQANGLGMLVHQGARSLSIWTGATVPVAVMQAAANAALSPS